MTAFKTVRVDELALQAHDINCETYDLAQLFAEMKHLDSKEVAEKIARLEAYTDCSAVPEQALGNLAALGCALDRFIKREQLDAIALRCWMEIQHELQISPCLLLSELNDRNIVAACEMDVANAVVMQALKLASNAPVCCMDWNNNYGSERDKCVLFHCGPGCCFTDGRIEAGLKIMLCWRQVWVKGCRGAVIPEDCVQVRLLMAVC